MALWSFWLVTLGMPHPMSPWSRPANLWEQALVFTLSECVTSAVAALAARRAGQPWLVLWVPMLQIYFPLAVVAVWRALWQVLRHSFLWVKTRHGVFGPTTLLTLPPPPSPHRASVG